MRYVCSAVFALLFSLSASAALTQSQQELKAMLLSGDLYQLKAAAQRIHEQKISDPALIDVAAEILLTKYPHAYSSEIDTIAWVARAIGASENGRYYNVLSEVIEKADNAKLERHAESALDEIEQASGEQYAAGMYQLPDGLYEVESSTERVARLKSLMLAGDLSSLKQAAKNIVDTNTRSQILTDIAAEILLTHYATAQRNQIDTFAWLTNAIGSTGSPRYVSALREIEENSDYRKLRRYAEKNRERLEETDVAQYQKGMVGETVPSYDN